MAKYEKYRITKPKQAAETHPVWRGIGCLLMIIVPIMSYALAAITVDALSARGLIPAAMLGHIRFPDWVWRTYLLKDIAGFIAYFNNLGAMTIFLIVFIVILSGIFSMIYSAAYQHYGPPRYTAVDAPPADYKPKVYKR